MTNIMSLLIWFFQLIGNEVINNFAEALKKQSVCNQKKSRSIIKSGGCI